MKRWLILLIWLLPTPALAATSADAIPDFFNAIAGIVAKFLFLGLDIGAAIAGGVIIWGGIQYMTGNKSARTTILAAIVGLIIILLSYVIIETLNNVTI